MQTNVRPLFLSLAVLMLASAIPVFGQTFGEISGRITDPSGAGVPGAQVSLTSESTNAVRIAVSTDVGDYTFPDVAPGTYSIRVERSSFKTDTSPHVEVQVQQSVRLDFALEVGRVNESVEVSAAAQMLQAEDISLGTVIENKGVTELPLNGRNYLSLVGLAANANPSSSSSGQAGSRLGGDRASQSISVGGNRIMFDYYTLDGATNTDPDFVTYVVLPSIDAIQEFKVQTGVYPAEFGHESTQINVVTKSGGNVYHGALFEFVRNDRFDAIPYAFTATHPTKSPFKWNDYGFEVDGPIRIPKLLDLRNRLFFMANDEWKAQRQNSQGVYSVPTSAMFGGNFSAYGTTIYDPATLANGVKTPFPGDIIPTNRLDPISAKLLNYYPAANLPGLTNNYTQLNASPNNRDAFTLRIDLVESAKSQWAWRYSWGTEDLATTGLSITGSKTLTNYYQDLLSNTRTITPNLVNEFRFGYTQFNNSLGTYSADTTNTVGALGIPNLAAGQPVTWGVPNISFAGDGFTGIGDSTDGPYAINDNTLQAVDNVSWIHGKHNFRFGFEYNRQNFDQIGNQFSRGQFIFQANATALQSGSKSIGGDAFAEFLLGDIYQSVVAVALASADFQRNVEAAFVDDTWKITPSLTLSLGVRYELTPPWYDTLNNLFTVAVPQIVAQPHAPNVPFEVRQGNCSNPYTANPPLNINWTTISAQCNNGLLPSRLMNTAYRDFAPRVGIAYSPNVKTVIRAGFGIFYNQDIGNAYFDLARNIAGRVTTTSTVGTPSIFWSNAAPGGGTASVANVPSPFVYSMAPDHHTTYVMQTMFNVQEQLTPNWALEIGYLGGFDRHLQGFQDANQAIPGVGTSLSSRTPYPGFSNIQYVQDGGTGDYNGLSIKATHRFNQGVSVIGSYTWSKAIDTTSGIRNQGYDTLYPQNSYCLSCERGLSAFDTRNRFVTSVLYDLPVGRDKLLNIKNGFLNTIIGGWEVGGILTLQSGSPGNLTIGGVDNASTGEGGYDRPSYVGISPYLSDPTPSRYWGLSSYVEAPAGQFGNVGRNSIEGPGIENLDAEMHKQFRMPWKESHILQFRFEAFNSINHPNWQMPTLNILSGAAQPGLPSTATHQGFGTVSGTSTAMRQIQLGLKYSF